MHSQSTGGNSNHNQQIQADGDVNAPSAMDGGVNIGGNNFGVVITSIATADEPRRSFEVSKKTRIPIPASLIGTVSGVITIAGFITGGFSVKQLIDVYLSGNGFDAVGGLPHGPWWFLGSMIMIVFGLIGWLFFRFLHRNVLRLPKLWIFRAWAGIKEENGRTYPYSLRLSKRCPECRNQKLHFQQVPEKWLDFYDNTHTHTKRKVTDWASLAVCPRHSEHSIPVDISGNDFDEALPR
ncbi:hypothetical protein QMG52_16575 [Paenarthrobacter sp. PH39-S1]|nr:hypothetical protein [Paenarthrobacter sp. PH39-S1]